MTTVPTKADKQPTGLGIYDLLEKRYEPEQGWLLFYEVANGTGFKGTGYADALAFNVWPSRGISLHGFELKRTRSDLIKELRDPTKAEAFQKYCHHWWLLLTDPKLADGVEVPAQWGILAPRNNVLYQIRPAPKLEPEPWKPEFIAAFMRRFHEAAVQPGQRAVKDAVTKRAEQLARHMAEVKVKQQADAQAYELRRVESERDQLRDRIKQFELDSGIPVKEWQAKNIGDIVRFLMNPENYRALETALANAKTCSERISKSLGAALGNLKDLSSNEKRALALVADTAEGQKKTM